MQANKAVVKKMRERLEAAAKYTMGYSQAFLGLVRKLFHITSPSTMTLNGLFVKGGNLYGTAC